MYKRFKIFAPFIIIVLLSLPLIVPFFQKGYFPTHDGEWAVVRAAEMFREIRDLQIPPRMSGVLNFGYGYPLFNFAYPFPYYLATILHFLNFGFVDSIKVLFALSVSLSGIFMYLLASKIWKNKYAGVFSALLFMYYPYRIVDLYVRGSLGESIAFVLVPLILLFLIKLIEKPNALYFVFSSVLFCSLILTHNIMALLFTPVIIVIAFTYGIFKKEKSLTAIITPLFFGILLSSFFLIPALLEKQFISLSQTPIADRNLYFVTIQQLFIPQWGYGVPNSPTGFGYQIGLAYIAILLIGIVSLVLRKFKFTLKNYNEEFLFILIAMSLGMIFLMFEISAIIWNITPLLSEINYPWTLLGPLGFVISLLAGLLIFNIRYGKQIAIFILFLSIFLTLPNAHPQNYVDRGDFYYLTNEATTTSSNELMPLWVREKPVNRYEKFIEVISGKGIVENVVQNSKHISASITASSNSTIRINRIYYPGWKAFINRQEIPIEYKNKHGVIDVPIPEGKSLVTVSFSETPVRFVANSISIITSIALLCMIIFWKKIKLRILKR